VDESKEDLVQMVSQEAYVQQLMREVENSKENQRLSFLSQKSFMSPLGPRK